MSGAQATVAVATCGRPGSLARCLRALAEQTEPAEEVLVVDQAPSADARSALGASGLAQARYVEQERLGLSASRNLALHATRTELLAVTDDDCVPDPSWLAGVRAATERDPRPGTVTGPILPLGDPPPGSYAISLRESELPVDYRGRIQPWGVGSGANLAAPVEVLRSHGGWDERLGVGSGGMAAEDADLIYRLLVGGAVVRYDPAVVVRHEWQTRARRLSTRWSYGYGIGAMCGLRLRDDRFAVRMLAAYARLHVRPLVEGLVARDRSRIGEHGRALASLGPGLAYGLRAASRPSATTPGEGS